MSKPEMLSREEVVEMQLHPQARFFVPYPALLVTIEALHNALVLSELARRGLEGVADHYLLSTSFDTREAVEEADAAVAKVKAAGWVSE